MVGLTQCATTIRCHVDALSLCHADDITDWRDSIESGTPLNQQPTGYSLCWDNVEIETKAKHQGINSNKHLMWGMCFASENRVNTNKLDSETTRPAKELPPNTFVLSILEVERMRDNLIYTVEEALVEQLTCLQGVEVNRPKHERYDQMVQKSNIINLGVVDANPASTPGTITIMSHLAGFVPEGVDITCGGDGMTMEKMKFAHRGRTNAQGDAKLQHLKPTPQEFHKEILMLQDTWKTMFTEQSKNSDGSLYHLKQYFRHRSLKQNVMENYSHSWDMLSFATHAYLTLFAMQIEKMPTKDAVPATLPDTVNGKRRWLRALSCQIVDTLWCGPPREHLVSLEAVMKLADADIPKDATLDSLGITPYCCGEEKPEDWVECSNSTCAKQWLHLSCAGVNDAPAGDFFCSPECEASGFWIGCFCHRQKADEIVQCSAGVDCCGSTNYHKSCLRMDNVPNPWYCREACRKAGTDHVYEYSLSLMWTGISQLTNHRALREGDGPLLSLFWKWQLMYFWNNKHPKYLTIAHNLLADLGGFVSPRIRQDLLWNRTANLQGRPNGNVGLDMVNEFLNKDFKERLKKSGGECHDVTIQRAARLGGAFGRKVDGILADSEILGNLREARHDSHSKYNKDVQTFTEDFKKAKLFTIINGRAHKGLETIKHSTPIPNIPALGKKLLRSSQKMDDLQQITRILNF